MKRCTICGASWSGESSACPLDGGALEALPDPLIGRTIGGRYVITAHIAAGGMGTVYRARHEIVGRDVAIKFLAPTLALDETNRRRFLREAQAANRIDHEHIIDITDYGETEDGLVYLVMELLDGEALSSVIARGPLELRRAIDIATQIVSALARAHELDVVHRDIKPDNIYVLARVGGGDFVKIIDFGLAKMRGEIRLTANGAMFGTPEYLAPEQARGAPATGKSDLYAFGCVLFEMLTGSPPFSGTMIDLVYKHMHEPAPSLRAAHPGLPRELEDLVARLLSKDPARRHRDGYQLLEELWALAEAMPRRSSLPATRVAEEAPTLRREDPALAREVREVMASMPETWAERSRKFRELARRAHPNGAPPWLRESLEALERGIETLRIERGKRDEADAAAQQHEAETRNQRLRLGRAIDVLGRDQSRAAAAVEALKERLEGARATLADVEARVQAARAGLPSDWSRESAEALREAGRLAEAWLEAEAALGALADELRRVEHEQGDLGFQIAQMKGRLGTLSAESDLELARLRERARATDRASQRLLGDLAARSGALVKHFVGFPALADAVRAVAR